MIEAPWKIGVPVLTKVTTAQISHSDSSTWSAASDLDLPLLAGGIYNIKYNIIWRSSVTTDAMRVRFNNLNGLTITRMGFQCAAMRASNANTAATHGSIVAFGVGFNFEQSSAIATDIPANLDGVVVVNAAGTFRLEFNTEVTSSAVTLEAGSSVTAIKLN